MIKKLLMAAAVVAMAVPAAAQGSRRSEVSVSYGVAPVTDWIDSYSDMLTGLFTNANTDLEGWGAVTVGYSFRLIGSLRLGAQVVYSSNTQEVRGAGSEIRSRKSSQFAFQVSPVGVEVGGRVAAYAEAGIGTSGCLLVGVRYRF